MSLTPPSSCDAGPSGEPGPSISLAPLTRDEAPTLLNLLELYAHDFSEHVPLDIKPNGRFDVVLGEPWWTSDDHFPFLLRSEGKLAGFALIRRGSRVTDEGDVMDVAEFFVLRGARRRRVGLRAAHAVFSAFPGRWEVRVRQSNQPALSFWQRAIEALLGRTVCSDAFSSNGVDWQVFRFELPRR